MLFLNDWKNMKMYLNRRLDPGVVLAKPSTRPPAAARQRVVHGRVGLYERLPRVLDYSMGKIDAIANIASSAFAILGRRLLSIV